MKLEVFASAWTFGSLAACRAEVAAGHFDGVEGPPPASPDACRAWRRELSLEGVPFVAEVCTGGDYAPPSSVAFDRHLDDLRAGCVLALDAGARFVTCLGGSDAWEAPRAVDFFGRAMALASSLGIAITFETHRGRPTFHPRATAVLLEALPALRLTCDFSHWCVVGERLPDDPVAMSGAIAAARHVHARVGYAQGPQVPDPRAPEFAGELDAHEGWWQRIWEAARARGDAAVTMTPEFGPDGYLHRMPFTREPVADLAAINRWMASRQRARFAAWHRAPSPDVEAAGRRP